MLFASIKPSSLGRYFGRYKQILLHSEGVFLYPKFGSEQTILYSQLEDYPVIKTGFFGAKMCFQTPHTTTRISLLNNNQIKSAYGYIVTEVTHSLNKRISDAKILFETYAVNEYLRNSSIDRTQTLIEPFLSTYGKSEENWNNKLSARNIQFLKLLKTLNPIKNNCERLREEYEKRILKERKFFYDRIESNPLTKQQRQAVIRNNDRNLVLAAAGTGKTSVIVAKAIDLIDSGVANPADVLVLAYNNAAAKELRERVYQKGSNFGINVDHTPSIFTFHALGRLILRKANIRTYLSEFSEDPIKLEKWVTQWLIKYIQSSEKSLNTFIDLCYQPINQFEFHTKEEYDAYVRDNEYRTLQGERVKGYQELVIANWLYLNCVDYEYEAPYVSKRRIDVGFDYRPDFHIKDTNIYIEHFGIDRNGNTRPDIDKSDYNEKIQSKRDLHEEHETVLLETYHYDWIENNLETRLELLMQSEEVVIRNRSDKEIFKQLNEQGVLLESSKRYLKCLQAIRVEQLKETNILSRLQKNRIFYAEKYTDLLGSIHRDYISELKKQDRIDFDDMIIRATKTIESGKFLPKWTHILVDEFQDISMARMNFLKKVIDNGPTPVLTVVGDDWQSIYRFSGGKLELTTRFDEMVGSCTKTLLEKTFRYNNSIAKTAGAFVMENPEQYKKHIVTNDHVTSSHVYLLDSKVAGKNNLEERVVQVIKAILNRDNQGGIAVLARYNYLLKNTRETVNQHKLTAKIKYWSFHGSKGLEADYCILIGFFQGKTGFPNLNKEEAVVESLLPSLDTYPNSEERRLLYVAITRAKKKSYLIADPMGPSVFINELMSPKFELNIVSKSFEKKSRKIFKCPMCTDGYFQMKHGKFGDFYSCTSGSVCNSKPRICDKCNSPTLDTRDKSVCNNPACHEEKIICDRCGRPMKLRDGKYGKFWGCTGYGTPDDQCKNTMKYNV